jgi:hypothetical protein
LSFRFQTDADLNPEIGRGFRRQEPSIDFVLPPEWSRTALPISKFFRSQRTMVACWYHETSQRCRTILPDLDAGRLAQIRPGAPAGSGGWLWLAPIA